MLRRILAVVAGLAVFIAIVALFDAVSATLFPAPSAMDLANPESIREYVEDVPIAALALVLTGSTLAALAGSYLSGILVGVGGFTWALVTGAIGLLATVSNAFLLPHPLWFMIAAPLGVIAATILGAWLSARKQRPARPAVSSVPPRSIA